MVGAERPYDPRRVLIVEDEALVGMFLADLVEDAGFHAIGPAATAIAALQLAEAKRPGIAVLDVSLGRERTGVELGAELSRRHATVLIFLSGHGGVANWPAVRALSPVAVLQKPCMPAALEEALNAAVKKVAAVS